MTQKANKNPVAPSHLGDAEILAYLDGELSADERQRASSHLEGCWTCRSTMTDLQARIDSFVQFRKDLLSSPGSFDDMRVEQFRQRLARHAKDSQASPKWWEDRIGRLGTWGQRCFSGALTFVVHHQKATVAVAVSLCLVVVMFTDVLNTRVSADTVLRRAESYESSLVPASGQVARSSVHVECIDRRSGATQDLGTLTILREPQTPIAYVSAQSPSGRVVTREVKTSDEEAAVLSTILQQDPANSNLVEYLTGRHWVPDVSAAGFQSLIEGRSSADSSARRDAGEYELHYPFAAGHKSGIAEAMLRVDAKTYAPESVSLTNGAQQEYRFTRTALVFRPRAIELASLNIPAERSNPVGGRSASSTSARAVPLTYANSQASEIEVSAAAALHQVDSCLGEEVYLFPMSDGSLLLQGLVATPARRDTIRQSLTSVSGDLHVDVYLPREIRSGTQLLNPPDQSPGNLPQADASSSKLTIADAVVDQIPLYQNLYKHFAQSGTDREATDKQVLIFSNEVVTLARQTFLHAWALKKLDREFTAARTAGLSSEALKKIESMRASHRQSVATLARQQQAMLSQVADPTITANAAQLASVSEEDLLVLAREQSELVRSLFTPSASVRDSVTSLTKLLALLRHMGA